MRAYIAAILILSLFSFISSEEESNISSTQFSDSSSESSSTSEPTSSIKPDNTSCGQHTTCEACETGYACYFCQENNKCQPYVLKEVLPNKECKLRNVYYATCSISLLGVIILISLAAGLVFIGLIVCCCCFCCRSGSRFKLSKDDLKWARQREERRTRAEEKRKERTARTEEIRRKYGPFKGESPYQRFDS